MSIVKPSIVKPSSTKKIYIATTSNEDELKEQNLYILVCIMQIKLKICPRDTIHIYLK